MQTYKIMFFGIALMEMFALFAITYIKIEFFPQIEFWWIAVLVIPGFTGMVFLMNKLFICPNCSEKLADADGFTIFADKCQKCGINLK